MLIIKLILLDITILSHYIVTKRTTLITYQKVSVTDLYSALIRTLAIK